MTVSEVQSSTVAVDGGGQVLPDVLKTFHREKAIFDRIRVFMDENIGPRRRRAPNVVGFLPGREIFSFRVLDPVLIPPDHAVHSKGSDPVYKFVSQFFGRLARAPVNVGGGVVRN